MDDDWDRECDTLSCQHSSDIPHLHPHSVTLPQFFMMRRRRIRNRRRRRKRRTASRTLDLGADVHVTVM